MSPIVALDSATHKEALGAASGEAGAGHAVLSHVQAGELLAARRTGLSAVETSLDLGRTRTTVRLDESGVVLGAALRLAWPDVEFVGRSETKCFLVEGEGEPREIRVFSEATGWVRSLYPTNGAPTTLVSGTLMHRIKGTDPMADTHSKIEAISPITGRLLDTATGLGYTAIAAARTAREVVTVELDPGALAIAALNPWSRELFTLPNIRLIAGDVAEVIRELEGGSFDRIIHDPPTISLAGELYGEQFYRELHRVLSRSGRLFHYIGAAETRSGSIVTRGVVRRLKQAGFSRVSPRPEAFGVVACR